MRWFDASQETVWHAVARADPDARRRRYDLPDLVDSFLYHVKIWWGGVALTLAAVLATWWLQGPQTIVTTRLSFDRPDEPSRLSDDQPALAQAASAAIGALNPVSARLDALRAAGWRLVFPDLNPDRPAEVALALSRFDQQHLITRDDDGAGIVVSAWHRDAVAAQRLDRALVDAALASQAPSAAPPGAADSRAALEAARARAVRELEAADRRAAVLSQSLTDLARDMVAALRATDNRSVSTEVSDQGAALLAELQMKRVQLASKYQDSYAPLVALDTEISKLRNVVASEQRRSSVVRSAADPVFTALAGERRRVNAELDTLNSKRDLLRRQVETIDHTLSAQVPAPWVPRLVAGTPVLTAGADPRFVSVPLMVLVGLAGTLTLQWLMLRARQQLVTPAEVELALGLPVLRCLDTKGRSVRTLDQPALRLRGPDDPGLPEA